MDCKQFQENMSFYIDDQMNGVEKKEFELHLLTCSRCRNDYENMIRILKEIKDEEIELPENFNQELRARLEKAVPKKNRKFNFRKFSMAAAACFVMLLVSYALIFGNLDFNTGNKLRTDDLYGQMEHEEDGYSVDMALNESQDFAPKYDESQSAKAQSVDREAYDVQMEEKPESKENTVKIIKEAFLEIEIEDYDKVFNEIIIFVQLNGGYIENANTYYSNYKNSKEENNLKQGNIRIRIPQDKFDSLIAKLREIGLIKNENFSERNITEQYYDVDNRVKNLRIQEERLREILKQAKNVEEILLIENELRRIRTEIDSHTSILKTWDSMVSMSVVNVSLKEVERIDINIKPVDNNIWTRAKKGFISTINNIIKIIENVIVFVITIFPVLIVIAAVVLILFIIVRKRTVRKK